MSAVNYSFLFRTIESTLISEGAKSLLEQQIRASMDRFRHFADMAWSDSDYFWLFTRVVFYSGFNAATVSGHLPIIKKYFPDYDSVSVYDDNKVESILRDREMISNERKVRACVSNARTFKHLIKKHGSFQNYVDSYSPKDSFENLLLLNEELQCRFDGIGSVTSYHVLTDIGLPVIKPDRVICRIFHRLGLIGNPKQILQAVIQGRKFARAIGEPERYVDIVFVAYGQTRFEEFGITQGICLDDPRCYLCRLAELCSFGVESKQSA